MASLAQLRSRLKVGLALTLSVAGPAVGAPQTYRITRDGAPIGTYRFSVEEQGGERRLAAEMNVKVKLFFIPIYRARHERQEVWQDGRLIRLQGSSHYNGSDYQLRFARVEGRGVLQVNDTTEDVADPVVTPVPWRPPVSSTATLLTEKGKTEPVTITHEGRESVRIAGQDFAADRFRVSGRKVREMWYDAAGDLLRIRYEDHGSTIDIERAGPDQPR